MSNGDSYRIRTLARIDEIAATDWNNCAGLQSPGNDGSTCDNPFLSHNFLAALEKSGSVCAQTGWQPCHLVLSGKDESVLGVMPLYVKAHSLGEYVFDHHWADALHRAGGSYYPKLQCAIPFTPATGRRLLVRPGPHRHDIMHALAAGALQILDRLDLSSLHITFCTREEWEQLGKFGFLQRIDQQFHWTNAGYHSFDEFLDSLTSRKRKAIRHERRQVSEAGISVQWLCGKDITEEHWDAFFDFYMDTGARKWGRPYLNRSFFRLIGQTMAERVLLVMCVKDGKYVAGALNFIASDTLFGRYWGCVEDYPFLHFETCYYQAIEYAITHGLRRVEAGAQGAHKIARGYLPEATYSTHYVKDQRLHEALQRYLSEERQAITAQHKELTRYGPYRQNARSANDEDGE
jgi:predicted N-acyltransferase